MTAAGYPHEPSVGVVAVYVLMFLAWLAAGLFMLFASAQFGNLVHDSFGLWPGVHRDDWGKKLILRLIGVGLRGVAGRFALRVAAEIRQGG
ncbi:MAG: hypothetical protein ABSB15_02355 [Bryobacteraceae bacterium]|jgi:hypothetical protein